MTDVILTTASRFLFPLFLSYSVFLLARGHNDPGGGFIAGLVASAAFALYSLAFSPAAARRMLLLPPRLIVACGLLLSLASGLAGMAGRQAYLVARWWELAVPGHEPVKVGTPLLFDAGVFLVVLGMVTGIILVLQEE